MIWVGSCGSFLFSISVQYNNAEQQQADLNLRFIHKYFEARICHLSVTSLLASSTTAASNILHTWDSSCSTHVQNMLKQCMCGNPIFNFHFLSPKFFVIFSWRVGKKTELPVNFFKKKSTRGGYSDLFQKVQSPLKFWKLKENRCVGKKWTEGYEKSKIENMVRQPTHTHDQMFPQYHTYCTQV